MLSESQIVRLIERHEEQIRLAIERLEHKTPAVHAIDINRRITLQDAFERETARGEIREHRAAIRALRTVIGG